MASAAQRNSEVPKHEAKAEASTHDKCSEFCSNYWEAMIQSGGYSKPEFQKKCMAHCLAHKVFDNEIH